VSEYRVDDLARAAGTTVRNVRAYAERGLLLPPERRGRANVYGDAHLARLRLIGNLLDRGYTFAHIDDFLSSWRQGHDLGQALGLEAALLGPGAGAGTGSGADEDTESSLTRGQLQETFGEVNEPALGRAITLGLLAPEGDRYRVRSPRLMRAGAELAAIGVPLAAILDVAEQLHEHVGAVAETFVTLVGERLTGRYHPGELPADEEIPGLIATVERLRPLARTAVDTELAAALDRGIQAFVTSWLTEGTAYDASSAAG
jgi:DNA-binding transcriptional MerR regulator